MSFRRERRSDEFEANHERWLVSYADFITLMFAFFAVLYATSEKDLAKAEEFQESVKRYLIKAGSFGETGQQIHQGEKNNSVIDSPIQTFSPSKQEAVKMLDQAETFVEAGLTAREKERFIQDIYADEWGVRIIIRGAELYAARSDKFRPDAVPFALKIGTLLAESNRKIMIEGHVASGERGGAPTTWDFASARAINFLRFLNKKKDVPANRLAAASFADTRPLKSADSTGMNSRLEIVLLNKDMEL